MGGTSGQKYPLVGDGRQYPILVVTDGEFSLPEYSWQYQYWWVLVSGQKYPLGDSPLITSPLLTGGSPGRR